LPTWYTANLVNVFHNILATGFDVGKEGDSVRDILEVIDSEFNTDRVGHRDEMQYGIGGTAKDHRENLQNINMRKGKKNVKKKMKGLRLCLTMAFSNADRVMISRGRMFFSRRPYITGPTAAHSSCFSFDSAGKEDDPGKVMPSASIALAIVLAVYI